MDQADVERKLMIEAFIDMSFSEFSKYADKLPDHTPITKYFVEDMCYPKITEWKGYKMSGQGFNTNMIKWVYDSWTPWKDDVIVASFPKTGTTWVRHIVRQLYFRNDDQLMAMTKPMAMPQIYLETGIPLKFEFLERLPWTKRVLATHVPAALINFEKIKSAGAKIIYTIRNPKDQLVSWHNMVVNMPIRPNDPDYLKAFPLEWKEFFEAAISGKQYIGNKDGEYYLEHLRAWYKHRNDENVLFVVYEDMKQDPSKEVKRIANFLGVEINEEDLLKVVEATSFKTMQKDSDLTHEVIKFYRKGEVGDWKNYFTVAQSERIDSMVKEKLEGTDIKFIYEL